MIHFNQIFLFYFFKDILMYFALCVLNHKPQSGFFFLGGQAKTVFVVYLLLAFTVCSGLETFNMEILQLSFHRPCILVKSSQDRIF